jgi:hypothetical protein
MRNETGNLLHFTVTVLLWTIAVVYCLTPLAVLIFGWCR